MRPDLSGARTCRRTGRSAGWARAPGPPFQHVSHAPDLLPGRSLCRQAVGRREMGRRTPAHRGRLRIRRRVRAGQRLLAHPGAQRPGTLPVRHPRPSDIIRRLPALSLAGRFRGVRPRPLALGQTRTHPGATAPPQLAGRATLPGRREARPDAANHPGAVPKPTSSCGTSSRLKTSTSHSPAQSSSAPASTPPTPSPTRPRGPARRRRQTARVAAGSRATPSHQTTPGAAAPRPGLMLTGCVPMPAVAGASLCARLFYGSMEERAPGGSPSNIPLSVPDGR